MGTHRGCHHDGLDVRLNPVFFRAVDGTPQVDVNVTPTVLHARIVDQDFYPIHRGELLWAGHICNVMHIVFVGNGAFRHIQPNHRMAFRQKFLRNAAANACTGPCHQHLHHPSTSLNKILLF